ncbi:hypothetical protein TKK_0000288 [Trichogramma kaykai]|uniref:Uncharacterized protein n=1 Tax=Trichogramma kaykai TaxID=54128 RepID=A0ABD2W7R7_9HYME
MDAFFDGAKEIASLKPLFIAAHIKEDDFFNLDLPNIIKILNNDVNAVSLFLPAFQSEKRNKNNNIELGDEILADDEVAPMDLEKEKTLPANIPDDFEYVKNTLYYKLEKTIEGKVILGLYKYKKKILYRRLKYLIVQLFIIENPITYKITNQRWLEILEEVLELFPTITPTDWYQPQRTNAKGDEISASGCLVNYYKKYRTNLGWARIINTSSKKATNKPTTCTEVDNTDLSLLPLTDKDRSLYTLKHITDVWDESFTRRIQSLAQQKNKKIVIHFGAYWRKFVCLHSSFGLDLLKTDAIKILNKLVESNSLSSKIADNFVKRFRTRWDELSIKICDFEDSSPIESVKDFRNKYQYWKEIPKSVLALFYCAFRLTKLHTVKIEGKGTFKFLREQCVDHFITVLSDDSEIDSYKRKVKKQFEERGLEICPYIIFCGRLDAIKKLYVVVQDVHYEIKSTDPVEAVQVCMSTSLALHSWQDTCSYVWLYLLEHVHSIRPDLSAAFPVKKTANYVKNYIKKFDSSFSAEGITS